MPIYEYACRSCTHKLDALQKINDEPLVQCPECGESELRRLVSAPRFRLKGQGWYETDFKTDKQRNLARSDAEPSKEKAGDKAATSDAKTSDSKGDSAKEKAKPAAKAADKPAAVARSGESGE